MPTVGKNKKEKPAKGAIKSKSPQKQNKTKSPKTQNKSNIPTVGKEKRTKGARKSKSISPQKQNKTKPPKIQNDLNMPTVVKKKKGKPAKGAMKSKSVSPQKQNKTKSPKIQNKSNPELTDVKKLKTKRTFDPIKANRGVVFIKHIPHGFYEEQLTKYFEQFGDVTRTRVARSEKTGRSKGFAFVEFKIPEVAKIAADTMDNYMMYKQLLKTTYIPPEQQKYNYFRNDVKFVTDEYGVLSFVSPKTIRVAQELTRINTVPTDDQHKKRISRAMYKLKKQQAKYNIDFNTIIYNSTTSDAKKMEEKPTKTKNKKEKAKAKAVQKQTKNDTLTKLLNETIENSDESDDDDFIPDEEDADTVEQPTIAKIKKKRKIAQQHLAETPKKRKVESNDYTLTTLLNETIDENDSSDDEDFVPDDDSNYEENSQNVVKPRKKRQKNKLAVLLNDTIDDTEDSSDDDFEPDITFQDNSSEDENIDPNAEDTSDDEIKSPMILVKNKNSGKAKKHLKEKKSLNKRK